MYSGRAGQQQQTTSTACCGFSIQAHGNKNHAGYYQEFNDINNITPSAKEWETEHTRVLDTHALRECKRWAAS
jgi:hypothetical protein